MMKLATWILLVLPLLCRAEESSVLPTETVQNTSSHRGLSTCNKGKSLYNAAVNVYTKRSTSCSGAESRDVQNFLKRKFDPIINNDSQFKNRLRMQTDFCQDQRRLVTTDDEDERRLAEAEEAEIMENLSSLSNGTDYLITDSLFSEDTSSHRDLTILAIRLFIRGNGRCGFICRPDDSDSRLRRRRLGTDWDYFYRESHGMEALLNSRLTRDLKNKYNKKNGHCLKGKTPFVKVHIVTHKKDQHLTKCWKRPTLFCCAPKRDPTDVCSKTEFTSWYCHETQNRCTRECNGQWVDALDPPHNCVGKWAECTNGERCCAGSTCTKKDNWYSQCL